MIAPVNHRIDGIAERNEWRRNRTTTSCHVSGKLNEEMVRRIRQMHADRVPLPTICQHYPEVTPWAIREVVARRSWRNVR